MVFRSPPTIIYGKGTVTSVGEQAARFGKKAMLVCGKGSLRKSGVLDIIVSSLEKAGVSCAVYDRVGSDPTTTDVDEGAAFAKENGCDVIVAAGGGSPLDAAKGIEPQTRKLFKVTAACKRRQGHRLRKDRSGKGVAPDNRDTDYRRHRQ